MKKTVSTLLLLVFILTFCACDDSSSVSVPPQESSVGITEASSLPQVSFSDISAEISEEESNTYLPEESVTEVSEPEESVPEVSEPEVSVPEVSEPEVPEPEVSVPEVSQPEVSQSDDDSTAVTPPKGQAVFLDTGFVLYNGAAYTQSYFSSANAIKYASVYKKYALLFPDTRINVIIAPLASITILDESVSKRMSDQGKVLDKMEAAIIGDVNFVNLKNVYVEHAEEYLFFKSDHHWTQRGAYYAYFEFARSVGLTPTPIEEFEVTILKENFIGSMYGYTKDERVKYYYDTVEAYLPKKACTMTIYNKNGSTTVYDTCIVDSFKSYSSFIAGDHPYMVINVPENDQNKSILVIKDSYGNAFVPFLTEHYGNIIVVDPRHTNMNLYEKLGDYGLDDIVFLVNSSMGNTSAWHKYFAKLIN